MRGKIRAILFYAVLSAVLIFVAASIVWQLFTTSYPTHSDVFWTGVQCGALGVLSFVLFGYGLFFLYRIAVRMP